MKIKILILIMLIFITCGCSADVTLNISNGKIEETISVNYYFNELYRIHCRAYQDSYKNINDGWDYQFHHDMLDKERFAIVPKGNLARSYGYTDGAFHPQSKREAEKLKEIMDYTNEKFMFPMKDAEEITLNKSYDRLRQKYLLNVTGNYLQRRMIYGKKRIKDFVYKYMPSSMWNYLKKLIKK